MSRGSAIGIATVYELDNRGVGVRVSVGPINLISLCRPDWLWAHPAPYPMGIGGSYPGGKAEGASS
jgi:hypothetical protein